MSQSKQVIILQKALNMRKGKMVAQGSHASQKYMCDNGFIEQKGSDEYFCFKLDKFWKAWLFGNFKKVVLGVNSEEEMINIYNFCKDKGLPVSLVIDNGLTEFNGVPTKTAIGIGPADESEIDLITGKNGIFGSVVSLL